MRSEKEVYDIVLNFAKTDKRIRMVTLEGSRTNTNIPPDDFQDFDITFFVTDMDSFTSGSLYPLVLAALRYGCLYPTVTLPVYPM